MSLTVKAGKVPGTIVELILNTAMTVLQVMQLAAQEIGRKRGLNSPAFAINTGDYSGNSGNMVDVPQLNGRMLAEKVGDRWENILWDTLVSDGDILLVVPKIQGNQFTVNVGRIPGSFDIVGVYEPGDPEAGENAGTVASALEAAGLELNADEIVLVNDQPANLNSSLTAGDTVAIAIDEKTSSDSYDEYEEEENFSEVFFSEASSLREKADELESLVTQVKEISEKLSEFGYSLIIKR